MVVVSRDKQFYYSTGKPKFNPGYYIDDNLKHNFDEYVLKGVKKDHDMILLITGLEGCLTGDTIIDTTYGKIPISDLMYIPELWSSIRVNSHNGKEFFWNKIHKVVYSGVKYVYELILSDNTKIRLTDNHKVMTDKGFIESKKLNSDSKILTVNGHVRFKSFTYLGIKHTYDIQCEKPYHNFVANDIVVHNSGKSTLAQMLAYYCDPTINVNRIVFSGTDLMHAIDTASPGQAIIFDEAIMDMSSQDHSTDMQKILVKKFTLIRKKRLIIFLVIPSFFMLRKYFAIFRTRAMINCYCPDGVTRGSFRFYSFNTKKNLFLKGYKEMNMGCQRPDFLGTFTNTYGFFVDWKAYEEKKDKAIEELTKDKGSREEKYQKMVEDYKEKVKIDIENFKNEHRKRLENSKQNFQKRITKYRNDNMKKFSELKRQAIDLQKTADKQKIKELGGVIDMYNALLFKEMEVSYKVKYNDNLSFQKYTGLLNNVGVTDSKFLALQKSYQRGLELLKFKEKLSQK